MLPRRGYYLPLFVLCCSVRKGEKLHVVPVCIFFILLERPSVHVNGMLLFHLVTDVVAFWSLKCEVKSLKNEDTSYVLCFV